MQSCKLSSSYAVVGPNPSVSLNPTQPTIVAKKIDSVRPNQTQPMPVSGSTSSDHEGLKYKRSWRPLGSMHGINFSCCVNWHFFVVYFTWLIKITATWRWLDWSKLQLTTWHRWETSFADKRIIYKRSFLLVQARNSNLLQKAGVTVTYSIQTSVYWASSSIGSHMTLPAFPAERGRAAGR